MVSKRYAKANNPAMEEYDEAKPTTYLQYLDANNLYGWAMCQPLPISGFEWEEPTPELLQHILSHPDDDGRGYMVECDLTVPEHLHDLFSDYPLAPEKLSVSHDMLSAYQQRLVAKLQVRTLKNDNNS